MVQFLDPSDLFTTNATGYGASLTGYMRFRPWTSDIHSGYSIPTGTICNLHNGYGANVAAFTGNTLATLGACLWRPQFFPDGKATLTFICATALAADDFRYAGVCGRCAGGTFIETSGQERYQLGNGYWFLLANDVSGGNQSSHSQYLLIRVNGGVTALIASNQGPLATDLPALLASPFTMSMEITGTHFECIAEGVSKISVDDAGGSSVQGAGRWGFGMIRDRIGSVGVIPQASAFQLEVPSGNVVHRDEWSRANLLIADNITDGFGIPGRDMMCMWGGDIHAIGTQFEATPTDRVRTVAGPAKGVSMRQATSATEAHRSITVQFDSTAGHDEACYIFLRGTGLHQMFIGGTNPAYGFELHKTVSGPFVASLFWGMVPAPSAVFATATITGLVIGTDIDMTFSVVNAGAIPRLFATINGVSPTWIATSLPNYTIFGNGVVEDHTATPVLSGLEEAFALEMNSGFNIQADSWLDVAPLAPGGQMHVSQELIEGFARIGIQPGDPMLVPEMRLSQLYLEGFAGGDLEIRLSQLLVEGFYGTDVAGIHLSQLLLEGFRDTAISSALDNCLVAQVAMPGAERVSAATASNRAAASRCGVERMSAKTAVVAAVGCGIGGVERMGVICG